MNSQTISLAIIVGAFAVTLPGGSSAKVPLPLYETLGIRYEAALGRRSDDGWLSSQSNNFVNIPRAAATFVARDDDTIASITFSAEAYTSAPNKRMFVRALVDGKPAEPSDVVFTEGPFKGARSFTFVKIVPKGIHSIEMQWLVDSQAQERPTAYLRGASVQIRSGQAAREGGGGGLWHAPPSDHPIETEGPGWDPIPDGGGHFWVPDKAETMLIFSAEAFVQGGSDKRMFIRPHIDGVATAAPHDVVFARGSSRGVRQFVFDLPGLEKGWHQLEMYWKVDPGGLANLGDYSIVVSTYPVAPNDLTHRVGAAPSGLPEETTSEVYNQVPDLATFVSIPENGEVSVCVSAEAYASAGSELWMRLNVGGEVVAEEQVVLARDDAPMSVQSFDFDRKHVFGADLAGISVEWKVTGGGQALVGDRTMAVVVEAGSIPDLAEAPNLGGGNVPLEPAIGTRKLLTILWNGNRPDPNDQVPAIADVTDALFGAHSVRDFFERSSGGRVTLQNEGVLGWYNADEPWQHYWETHPGCPGGSMYTSGHQEKWAEAIDKADVAGFPFSDYDTDGNGILEAHELGILIIIPQETDFGTAQPPGGFKPYCNGDPYVTDDGVEIPELFEWYTSRPLDFAAAAHELSHLFFRAGDLYNDGYKHNCEPGNMSLMGGNRYTTAHFDPLHKLYYGWVNPVTVRYSDLYDVVDVKVSEEVLILPRRNSGDGREYFILENRQSSDVNPLYDEGIAASGIVIWHIIEDPKVSDTAPNCEDQGKWDAAVSGNSRRGIRLMRPSLKWGSLTAAWTNLNYDLFDAGLICPSPDDDPLDRRNILTWADGTPSGYTILNWPTNGDVMTIQIIVN